MGNLSGAALEEVDGYPITNSNYEVVKQVLSERFGNRTQIRQSLMTQLIKIPTAQGSVKSISQTMTQIERICRILEGQGLDIDNEQVLCTIEAKMPQWMLREVYAIREMFPDRYNVKALRNIIRAKICISEATEFMSGTLDSHTPRPKKAEEPSHEATLFATSSDTDGDHDKPKCYLCHEKHWVTDCFAFPDPESRNLGLISH
ncbi:Integrase core domain containing protein [Aphelenchoides avenae]|nr:Integrase core domain containing protein [Aphelenchus avenae]